jgi:hypothetical protein
MYDEDELIYWNFAAIYGIIKNQLDDEEGEWK